MPPKRKVSPKRDKLPVIVIDTDEDDEVITSWPAFRTYYANTYGKASGDVVAEAWAEYKEVHGLGKESPRKRGSIRKVSPPKQTPVKAKSPVPVFANKKPLPKPPHKPLPKPPGKHIINLIVSGYKKPNGKDVEGYSEVKKLVGGGKSKQTDFDDALRSTFLDIDKEISKKYKATVHGNIDSPSFNINKLPGQTDIELEDDIGKIIVNLAETKGEYTINSVKFGYWVLVARDQVESESGVGIIYIGNAAGQKKRSTPPPEPKKKSDEFKKISATKGTQVTRKSNSNIKKVEVHFTIYKDMKRLTNPSKAEITAIEKRVSNVASDVANKEAANVPVLDYSEREQTVSVYKDNVKVVFTQDTVYTVDEAIDLVEDFINSIAGEGPIRVGKDRIELYGDPDAIMEFNTFPIRIAGNRSPYRHVEKAGARGNSDIPDKAPKLRTPLPTVDRKTTITYSTYVSATFGIAEQTKDGKLKPIPKPLSGVEKSMIKPQLDKFIADGKLTANDNITAYFPSTGSDVELTVLVRNKSKHSTVTVKYLEDLVLDKPLDGKDRILYLY